MRNVFADKPDFHFRLLKVLSVDCTTKTIDTVAGELSYDYLIIASGSRANFFGNTDIQKLSFPLKTIPEALNLRSQLMQVFEIAGITNDPAQKARLMNVVLVGAGPTGLMLAGELALAGVDVALVEQRASQALAGSRALGGALVAYILCASSYQAVMGRPVTWRGRSYPAS